jgi:putative sugar O-methyltransferase
MPLSMEDLREIRARLAADKSAQSFYDRFPRNMWWENQECSSTELIQRSDTPAELVQEMQRTYLFSIDSEGENRRRAIDWLLTKYREAGLDIFELPPDIEESPVSYRANSVVHEGRRLSVDFLRTVSVSWDIRRLIQTDNTPLRVVELGGGLGHLARTLRLMKVAQKHVIIDLPESLIFSYSFLTLSFPAARALFVIDSEQAKDASIDEYDFVFVPSCFAGSVDFTGVDLFVNTASMGEMRNETIRHWMTFVQDSLPVKHLFVQNRFLNTINPELHAFRWNENECSVRLDRSWTVLKWDLEPIWFRCPYVVSISARHLEIAATRVALLDATEVEKRRQRLIDDVRARDWIHRAAEPPYMSMRQNPFVTDVTMTGTLFKLWEAIRLQANSEAAFLMLQYLKTFSHDPGVVFEEERFYENLLLTLVDEASPPDVRSFADQLRADRTNTPVHSAGVELIESTRDYNIVAVELAGTADPSGPGKVYLAVSKAMGHVDILRDSIGARDLPPLVLRGEDLQEVLTRARSLEPAIPELVGNYGPFNVVRVPSGFIAVARSLGPTQLLHERLGERDLAPVVLTAPTYETLREKMAITEGPT